MLRRGSRGTRRASAADLPRPAARAAEPAGEAVAQAEPAGRQPLVVSGADGAVPLVLHVGRVHVGREGRDERVEHVGREGDERR